MNTQHAYDPPLPAWVEEKNDPKSGESLVIAACLVVAVRIFSSGLRSHMWSEYLVNRPGREDVWLPSQRISFSNLWPKVEGAEGCAAR